MAFNRFGCTRAPALAIFKAIDRVWHESLKLGFTKNELLWNIGSDICPYSGFSQR